MVDKERKAVRQAVMFLDMGADKGEMVDTAREDYENFCAGVMLYSKLLGLTDWSVQFHLDEIDGHTAACVSYNYAARAVSYTLNKRIYRYFQTDVTMMMRLALHEVLHLLLAEMSELASMDNLLKEQRVQLMNIAEHGVVRKLENILLTIKCESDDYRIVRV